MKKFKGFNIRLRRDEDNYRGNQSDFDEDDYPEDEDYSDDEEYPEDGDYSNDEDYPEDEDYSDDEEYPEDEDYSDDEEYPDDEYLENKEYSDDREYTDGDDDYPDEYYSDEIRDVRKNVGRDNDEVTRDKVVYGTFTEAVKNDYPSEERTDYPDDDHFENDDYPEEEKYSGEDRYSEYDYTDGNRSYEDGEYPKDDDYPDDEDDDYPVDRDYQAEEDDDYPDDEEYPDEGDDDYTDEEYSDDDNTESLPARILTFIKNTSLVERMAAIFALVILAGGIGVALFYSTAMGNRKQLDSFSEITSTVADGSVVGERGIAAVADAERARTATTEIITPEEAGNEEIQEEEEKEVADDAEDVVIKMTLTSIKSDLKVKFINSITGKLVANLPLEIEVVTPDGTTVTYNDHDQDGIIYKKDITAGDYKVTPKKLPAGFEKYNLAIETKTLTVKDKVEMKAVDVSNEVKKESQVNVAAEDTAVKTEVESKLADTVEWVESTKTAVGENTNGEYTYEEVDKNSITDPSSSSMLGFNRTMLLALTSTDNKENPQPEAGNENASEGSNSDSGENSQSSEGESKSESESENKGNGSESGSTEESNNSGTEAENDKKDDNNKPAEEKPADDKKKEEQKNTDDNKTSGDNKTSEEEKKTQEKDKTIAVTTSELALKVGEHKRIEVTEPAGAKYKSNDEKIAVVDGNGEVTAVTAGNTTVTVSAEGYKSVDVKVNVQAADKNLIVVTADKNQVQVGETVTLSIAGPTAYKCVSKNEDKVKVVDASKGLLIAIAEGTADIVISADGYESAQIKIEVKAKAAGKVPLSISKLTLVEGVAFKLSSTEANLAIKLESNKPEVASVSETTITARAAGEAVITVSSDKYESNAVTVYVVSKGTVLKDNSGNVVYVKDGNGNFREATYSDYYGGSAFYRRKAAATYRYTGWQTIDGKTYFFDKNGNAVTGEQVIQGAKYTFGSDGVLSASSGVMGIDVSKWNGNIDWNAVKNSGIKYVIIRCGYRGSSQGALIEDSKFRSNIKGALNAGLQVGVYFFTQAVNEVEAVEEASMVISLLQGYNISYPVYLDVEASNGRGDKINASQRTANIKAFCGTIQNAGYRAGVYANKTWFTSFINTSQLTGYKIWLAQYAQAVTYNATRYDMWQYSSKGRVTGISGNVDMNICY
ncbi:GH25 family lysozyme [Butyrivibrio sp. YAB3001]|uniref:GH25 family lysozyme n=1 Tax=Butyrivibrio sp. YAB3001 TaxID=1520812 RepID=UPI0008F62A85|nr:GH25 family lysozyme [Butyrivibrio sp. YAB3001]SFC77785.1 Putative cell wall binding repeat-containing protein [Butyrivibrio sp. YAB3001]